MKYTHTKKIAAIVLSALIMLCMPLSLCAGAAKLSTYPIIYVPDISEIVIYQKPNSPEIKEVFNVNSSDFLKNATGIVTGLFFAASNAQSGAAQVNSSVNRMMNAIRCDEEGNSLNSSLGAHTYIAPVDYYEKTEVFTENIKALVEFSGGRIGTDKVFVFNYDWRLDPLGEAEKLRAYIDKTLISSGSEKVRLLSGGFGGIIVNSYLYSYQDHAANNVASCVFLDSMICGVSIIGDIMSGHVVRTVKDSLSEAHSIFDLKDAYDVVIGADVGAALARYLKQDPAGLVSNIVSGAFGNSASSDLFAWFAKTLAFDIMQDEGMLDKVGKGYKEMLVLADNDIYSGGLAGILRNMPGMWAMVPVEEYEDAIEFMFGSKDDMDEELLKKLENYRNVINSTETTLKIAQQNINVDIVAGYGMQVLPVTAAINEQSDGLVATRYAGVGATTGDMDKELKLVNQCGRGNHNHMEPGNCVDASTCYLPENTWFIKNHNHMEYSSSTAAEFVFWLLSGDSQRNVYQNPAFPQYMQKAVLGDKVYAYSTPSDSELNDYSYGDLNIDGEIDSADARLALRYAVGLEDTPSMIITIIGDVTGDGKITAADARSILRYSVGLDNSFSGVI